MQNKTTLRQELISRRAAVAADLRSQWDQAIGIHTSAWLQQRPTARLGIYWPMRNEPDLRDFYAGWASRGWQLALPVVTDKNSPLTFIAWQPGAALVQDAMGVWIPAPGATTQIVEPDVLLVPCVGFSAERLRLGYGGGFYDRTLAHEPRPATAGIAYGCTAVQFEAGEHDIALDIIITEDGA